MSLIPIRSKRFNQRRQTAAIPLPLRAHSSRITQTSSHSSLHWSRNNLADLLTIFGHLLHQMAIAGDKRCTITGHIGLFRQRIQHQNTVNRAFTNLRTQGTWCGRQAGFGFSRRRMCRLPIHQCVAFVGQYYRANMSGSGHNVSQLIGADNLAAWVSPK